MTNNQRSKLIKETFVEKHWPSRNILFEYINISMMKETERLKMHFDTKNDWRKGYSDCLVYSYVKKGQ